MDSITQTRADELHPEVRRRYLNMDGILTAQGVMLRIVQGKRSWTEQANLYAKGRTAPGEPCVHEGVHRPVGTCADHPLGLTVTKAMPGYSWHQFGLALDAVPDDDTIPGWQPDWDVVHHSWKQMLDVAKSCGFSEGAEWRTYPDAPHLYPSELPATPDSNVRYAFQEGGEEAVWNLYPNLSVLAAGS